jgi:hypothetical protein
MEARMSLGGIGEGIAGNAVWNLITASLSKLIGHKIQITSPAPQGVLGGRQSSPGGGANYEVRGKLKSLRRGDEIWLLHQEQTTGELRPQGSQLVQYDSRSGDWYGRISDKRSNCLIKIVAVVAPPTSQDFFRYYEKVGHQTNYTPLQRIPLECVNWAFVQTRTP